MSILGKKSVIKRVSREIETDDIFLDALAKKQGTGYEKIETALSQRNFTILFVFFSFVILLLLSISFYFQVVQHSFYGEKANKNKFAFKELDAQRGIIYDRNMTQLVSNVQSFDLVCNTLNFSEDEGEKNKEIIEIAKILNISFEELEKTIEEKKEKGEFVISYDLEKEKVIVFKARESEFSAFSIKKNQKREYVDGNMFSNIIGYVNRSEEKENQA
jgi:cell division protein FtsI/penicillin-binding protein 2